MAKAKLFIGSSRENQATADALQQELDHATDVEIWHQGTFQPSEYPLESLESMLDRADFAAFIIAPDDITLMRGEGRDTMRDNVLFELGLFLGRLGRKRVFLIAPRDHKLDMPSDLVGLTPLTYDSEKENRRAALGPTSTAIKAAVQREGSLQRQLAETAVQEDEETAVTAQPWKPAPNEAWDQEDYARAYFISLMVNGVEEAKEIDSLFRATQPSPEQLAVWQSEVDWSHLRRGQHRPIGGFRSRSETFPTNAALRLLLASALEHYGETQKALEELRHIADNCSDLDIVATAISRINSLAPGSQMQLAETREKLLAVPEKSRSPSVLQALRGLAKSVGLGYIAKSIDEVRLSENPDDTDLRFELAYGYSEDGRQALALYHYKSIPSGERSGTAWNNLGVAYSRLGMQGFAVEAYERAARDGETIADANIAQKLLDAGFHEQATERLHRAVALPHHHENVVAGLAKLKETLAHETTRIDEVSKEAALERENRLELGTLALGTGSILVEGDWLTDDGPVKLRQLQDGTYAAKGRYERKKAVGLGLFAGEKVEQVDVVYRLTRFGDVFEGTVKRTVEGKSADAVGLLAAFDPTEHPIVLSLRENGSIILVQAVDRNHETIWRRPPARLTTEN